MSLHVNCNKENKKNYDKKQHMTSDTEVKKKGNLGTTDYQIIIGFLFCLLFHSVL